MSLPPLNEMTPSIEIKELPAPKVSEALIPPPKAGGWLAWVAQSNGTAAFWFQAMPAFDLSQKRDSYRCPYPFMETREEALEACAKALPNGGQRRIVRIDL